MTLNILIYEQSDITIEKHYEKIFFFYIAAVIQFITKYDRFDVIFMVEYIDDFILFFEQ